MFIIIILLFLAFQIVRSEKYCNPKYTEKHCSVNCSTCCATRFGKVFPCCIMNSTDAGTCLNRDDQPNDRTFGTEVCEGDGDKIFYCAYSIEDEGIYYCNNYNYTNPNVCNSHGKCVKVEGTIGTCECEDGWKGTWCQQQVVTPTSYNEIALATVLPILSVLLLCFLFLLGFFCLIIICLFKYNHNLEKQGKKYIKGEEIEDDNNKGIPVVHSEEFEEEDFKDAVNKKLQEI